MSPVSEKAELIVAARWIVPVEPVGCVLEDHSIAVDQGRIVAVLPTDVAQRRYPDAEFITRPSHVLIPGLVNAHTHAAMTLLRGLADDLPLMDWLQNHIWPAESHWVSREFVRDGTEIAIAEMIASGTTCFQDMYFFPDAVAAIASGFGMRAVISMIVFDFPSAWAGNPDEYLDKGLALRDEFKLDPLLSFSFGPHAPYTVSDETFARIRVLSDELGLPLHIHLHETSHEIAESVEKFGVRPLQRLKGLRIVGPNLLAVHATHLDDSEIAMLASENCSVIHCPESNLKLASGFCQVKKLIDAGVNVALGTDGAASNNDLDMIGEMRTAALLAKGVAGDASAIPASTALQMATLNGARALALDHEIGSLVAGKSADMVCIDLDALPTQPVYDPVSTLVYAAGREQVSDVWVAGKALLKNRRHTRIDQRALRAKSAAWQMRLDEKTRTEENQS